MKRFRAVVSVDDTSDYATLTPRDSDQCKGVVRLRRR